MVGVGRFLGEVAEGDGSPSVVAAVGDLYESRLGFAVADDGDERGALPVCVTDARPQAAVEDKLNAQSARA